MARRSYFRKQMITNANLAAEALRDSPIAAKLKASGHTAASMSADAKELTDLHTQVQVAKAQLLQASAALQAKAAEFAETWSTFGNLVRGFSRDRALRRAHGVYTPGARKGPAFRRTKSPDTETTAPAPPPETATAPAVNGSAKASSH